MNRRIKELALIAFAGGLLTLEAVVLMGALPFAVRALAAGTPSRHATRRVRLTSSEPGAGTHARSYIVRVLDVSCRSCDTVQLPCAVPEVGHIVAKVLRSSLL